MDSQIVSRRVALAGAGAIAISSIAGLAATASGPRILYVSHSGNDDADGLTPTSAWATIHKVNSLSSDPSVVLFQRGDTFYGELELPANCEIGAYGTGSMPVLTMFKLLNRPDGWVEDSAGIWRIDLGSPDSHDGYTNVAGVDIGFLLVNETIKPNKADQLSDVTNQWDFWSDNLNKTLYVASMGNPTSLAADIRAAPVGDSGQIVRCNQGSNRIHDVHVTGTGAHGITGSGVDVHIHDCLLDNIGGAYLAGYKTGTVRYGNGIENSTGAKRWLIESNEFTQTYDVAYTCQGSADEGTGTWEDITVRDNHIHHCTQTFEFWSTGPGTAGGFKNIRLEKNLCEQAGFSDFAAVRPSQAVRTHLLTYEWELPADIVVADNTFDAAFSAYSYHSVDPIGLTTRRNAISLAAGTRISWQHDQTIEQAQQWQAITGQEVDSTFAIIPTL